MASSRSRQLVRHLTAGAAPFWWSVLPVLFSLAIPAIWFCLQAPTFRYSGLALQLLGLLLVGKGLRDKLQTFEKQSVSTRVAIWFTTLWVHLGLRRVRSPAQVLMAGSGSIKVTGSAAAVVIDAPRTVEQRLAAIEAALQELRTNLAQSDERTARALKEVRQALDREAQVRKEADEHIHKLVEDEAVGDWHLETLGLVWLCFGILFAGIPDELAKLLGWLVPC